ncbi:amino acid adenylation domain-containing protein [Actinokineospora baliensis]|uniref:non-ribosomal peptide synthetase/type I polyketide synthase n=1 Tax=Actinokineospora baliensis TaxID=547056 RepID=UPI00195C9831|nr:non-ribosomal peptide synthetase/type I polyketide synthase [Actinokineospora baliensis]MBM7776028.1 amino acid adenylation domain-containing protein [Actinokineospora baliensis]
MTAPETDDRHQLLVQSVVEIRKLRARIAEAELARSEPIAIVGMACRMPGGADTAAFWELLRSGGDAITEVPDSRWDTGKFYDPAPDAPGRTCTKRAGLLSDVDQFDAPFFGISPKEAATLDPQQRLVLEVGWEALEDAGIRPDDLAGSRTGVFLGVTNNDYGQLQVQQVDPAELRAHALTTNASTFAAGRLSYWLGLSGPSMSVDTACSSSLVGLHLACQSLRSGETSMALAGGVNVLLSPEWFVVLSKAGMLAPDGRCKTFDAAADGYVRGEGCGVVVLKRLSDAQRDGDRIWAVVRGSAVNQDGRSSGVTVPNAAAQRAVIGEALTAAGVRADQVGYVEAHGTGTPLGDPIELRALDAVLGDRAGGDPVLVGSVKTNIGHLEPAAGIAGLIKAALALHHGEIPAHLHLTEVNPEIGIEDLALRIPTALTPWPRGPEPRVAAVSSFGASGTNAHVVLAEAPLADPPDRTVPERAAHLLTLSAKSLPALTALAERYRDRLARTADDELADVCRTANTGRATFAHRLTVAGATPKEMHVALTEVTAGATVSAARQGYVPAGSRTDVVFLFTGQGAQYAGMAGELDATEPVFRAALDECDAVLAPLLGRPLRSVLDPQEVGLVDQTRYTQPALFAVEYALAQLWRSWGVEPAAVLGHSVGELVAACVAGVLDLPDAARLAARRGALMQDLTTGGAMAAVFASSERVQPLISDIADLALAAVNGPESVVISGAEEAVAAAVALLAEQGVRTKPITVSRAFHSPLMDPMLDAFEAEASTVDFQAARIPLVSNLDGGVLRGEGVYSAEYLRAHVRRPVDFHAGMRTLFDLGYRTFVEIGPAPTLTGMAKRFAPTDEPMTFLHSLRPQHSDAQVMLESLGALHVAGVAVDWAGFEAGRARTRVDVPLYPFQRSRHWFTPSAPPTAAAAPAAPTGLLGRRVPSPLDLVQFESVLDAAAHPCLGDCVVDGLPVINIGVYLEAAFAAAVELVGPGPAAVRDCLVLQSLVLDHDERTAVHLVVEPTTDGGHSFDYYGEHAGDWVRHARGFVHTGPQDSRTADLDAIRARLADETSGADFYRAMWRRRVYLGAAAQWIEHIHHVPGEALARMRVPGPRECDPYLLHPGLTDAMFQALFSCLPERTPSDAVFMLVGVERFAFHGYDPDQTLYTHVVLHPAADPTAMLNATVRLVDAAGNPVAEAEGVYLKRAQRSSMLRTQAPAEAVPAARRPLPASPKATGSTASISDSRTDLLATSPVDRPGKVTAVLAAVVGRALGARAEDLDVHEPLPNLGLDSLMALEVKDALSAELGIALPLVAFLEGRSITGLGEEVLGLLGAPTEPTEHAGSPRPAALVADRDNRHEPFPLTDLQQAYLVGRSGAFELGDVSTYFFLEVDVEVDLDRLQSALRTMIIRHDQLRAVVSQEGWQRVLPEVEDYVIAVTDLSGAADQSSRLAEIHRELEDQVFDTATWPLFDVRATRLDDTTTRLHIGLDALIIDAWSTSLLFKEWAATYRGEVDSLPELEITYRDYVTAAAEIDSPAARDYWKERIATLPPAPELPLAVSPASIGTPRFTHRSTRLDPATWSAFKRNAQEHGVTASAALATAYAQVLAAWSKSSDFTLNVLFFNRVPLHPQVPDVVGNFSATTLLEVHSAADEAFAARADRVQRQLWTDLEHSAVSGVEVLRELNRTRGTSGAAGMPVVFASMVNFSARDDEPAATGLAQHLAGLSPRGREVSSSIRTPQVWLDHQVVEDMGALLVNWDVVEALFPEGVVAAMFAAYVEVLHELSEDPAAWRRPAPVLVPPADLAVRARANATDADLPTGLLHGPFLERAAARPDDVAVLAARTLTYGDLDARSNQVDRWLRANGVTPGALVAVVMDKGWEQVVATLGVLKAGAAYVPVDAGVPAERLRTLLELSGAAAVLTQSAVERQIRWPEGTVRLSVDLDSAESTEPLPATAVAPRDLAYVIFTSGSTGTPKGVMIEHAAALNTIHDVNDRFGITAADRVLGLSALNFDLSVYDVFGALAAGAAVVLPEPSALREPARWAELVTEHRVTVWNSVPTLMEMFTEHALAAGLTDLPVRVVMMSGDWIPVTLPGRIRTLLPQAGVWSLGGATEAAIWSILYPIGDVDPGWTSIPYGTPMRNQRFHVLNDAMRPCPTWVPGQLYIAGVGLARGYLGDQARTRASFVRHPVTGERLYRTGDLGRYLPDGTIEFLGREDFQVKVNGFRIELGEVDAALLRRPGIRAAVAAAVGERHAKRLVAYVVGDAVDETDLLAGLRAELPEYLVPSRVVALDSLPLSANGKVDRAALPAPDATPVGAAGTGPRDAVEVRLAEIWAEFFPTAEIGVDSHFFALGGDSLLAVRLMSRVRSGLGRSLPLATLFARPTIAQLAEALRGAAQHDRRALVPIRTTGQQTPLFFVHPVGGDVLCYSALAELLGPDQPFHGLQTPDEPPASLSAMAAHYVEAITAVHPGPYRLGGWSMGGVLAVEIARQLAEAGRAVEFVAVVDLVEAPGSGQEVDESALLSWFARDLAGLAGRDWTPAGFTSLREFYDRARAESVLPHDIDFDTLTAIVDRFSHNSRALLAHRPRPYPGPVLVLRARHGATTEVTSAWLALFGPGSEVVDLEGDHYSVMRPPLLAALADRLRTALPPCGGTTGTDEEASS